MTQYEAFVDLFVNEIGGSYLVTALLFLLIIWIMLMLIRAKKEVFIGVSGFYLYYTILSGFFPPWTFFIIIIISGSFIGIGVMNAIFNNG
jgi:hypothetical protein